MKTASFTILLALLALPTAASAADGTTSLIGTWVNSKSSVIVQTEPCGPALCGKVVWANAHAQEDARQGGVTQLVGTQVLSGFKRVHAGEWKGTIFVPERGRTFSSRIFQLSRDQIRVQGCILAGLVCDGEDWVRR
ncbi:MAG: DUF2147 domain-containing protein [Sphingomonadales bacterium]